MSIIEKKHWADPIIAHSEETVFLVPARGEVRMEEGIRHAVNERDYARMALGLACTQCCTPFPFQVGPASLEDWRKLTAEEFRFPPPSKEHGLSLVAIGCCPVCGFECSPEMMALQDEGHLDDHAAWDREVDGFSGRAEAYFWELERRRKAGELPKTVPRPIQDD